VFTALWRQALKTILSLILLSITFSISALEISNFKSGLACTDGETFGWICFEGEDVHVTGQGRCVYDGENIPCTWYGYEFDYIGYSKETKIFCEVKLSEPWNLGDPQEVIKEKADNITFELELPSDNGHYFNPLYVGLSDSELGKENSVNTTVCMVNDEILFEFKSKQIFPKRP